MVITQLAGGLGNQLFRYAAGRRLAHKWKTEFKLDISVYSHDKRSPYGLNSLNIIENFVTPEEIQAVKTFHEDKNLGKEKRAWQFWPEVLDWPDNLYLSGAWEDERYFADIADIIRREFTLKEPLSIAAQHWKEKILMAECAVSLHVRHGDFAYSSFAKRVSAMAILPLDYYYQCIENLKHEYNNLTLFVFSNNLQWCKENIHAGVPIEFVSGQGLSDIEEIYLISLCKHNIMANSTFSFWGAWLNQNPDKKVFMPMPASFFGTKNIYRGFSVERNENSPLDSDKWIRVPFNNNQSELNVRPIFSLLLVVNNDVETISETLDNILDQDYKYYEVIIIDNASTDGSGEICQEKIAGRENVTFKRLYSKVKNSAAWNTALNMTWGGVIMFPSSRATTDSFPMRSQLYII